MRSTPKSATSNKTNMIDARSDASNYIWFPTSNELVSLTRVRRKKTAVSPPVPKYVPINESHKHFIGYKIPAYSSSRKKGRK